MERVRDLIFQAEAARAAADEQTARVSMARAKRQNPKWIAVLEYGLEELERRAARAAAWAKEAQQ